MMVALTVYAYAVGERSSRAIERRCREDVAFRVIAANLAPDHATIARFRARHQDALAGLFDEVLSLCARSGVVQVGTIAVDGTKIHANASRSQNRTYADLAREIMAEADAIDAAEDAKFGDRRGDELPPEMASAESRRARLRELKDELDAEREARVAEQPPTREARVAEARKRLEEDWRLEHQVNTEWRAWHARRSAELAAEGRKMMGVTTRFRPDPPAAPAGKINVTDPDSLMVKSLHGWLQGYTAQAVATEGQIIVAADVIVSGNERRRLTPMVDQAIQALERAGIDEQPETVLADAGFFNTDQIDQLAARGIQPLVSPDASGRKAPGRMRRSAAFEQMRQTLETDEGWASYRRRSQIIEPVFAHTKTIRRADRFQRRGLPACRAEWRLIAATHNLLKLWRLTSARNRPNRRRGGAFPRKRIPPTLPSPDRPTSDTGDFAQQPRLHGAVSLSLSPASASRSSRGMRNGGEPAGRCRAPRPTADRSCGAIACFAGDTFSAHADLGFRRRWRVCLGDCWPHPVRAGWRSGNRK